MAVSTHKRKYKNLRLPAAAARQGKQQEKTAYRVTHIFHVDVDGYVEALTNNSPIITR
jgi:hypothetical protein